MYLNSGAQPRVKGMGDAAPLALPRSSANRCIVQVVNSLVNLPILAQLYVEHMGSSRD